MSNNPECVKGGISLVWKIENFNLIQTFGSSGILLECTDMKMSFFACIRVITVIHKKIYLKLSILRLDTFRLLSGIITAINGNFSFTLAKFDAHNFREYPYFLDLLEIPSDEINFEKENLINKDTLTLHMKLWDPNINDLLAAEYFVRSPNICQVYSFQWTLKGDRDWVRNGNCIESSTDIPIEFTNFHTKKNVRLKIKLQIKDRKLFTNVMLKTSEKGTFSGKYRFNFQRKKENKLSFFDIEWNNIELTSNKNNQKDFIKEDDLDYSAMELVVNIEIVNHFDRNSVIERICYEPNDQNLKRKTAMPLSEQLSNNNLQHSMNTLYKEGALCDITLCSDYKKFPCHKVVLSARSSVFRAMFENDMIETKTNVVNIDDVKPRLLGIFLDYLYSDTLEDEDFDSAVKLYAVADKYAVLKLQKKCADIIVSGLSTENACKALDLADNHQDDELKEEITLFFNDHVKTIMNSPYWEELLSKKPFLAAKTAQDVLNRVLQNVEQTS